MLVEFRIANFQSIRTEQTLNLRAVKIKKPTPALFATGIPSHPFLLRSALVYGANASGKTTLVRALQTMQAIVRESASQSNENTRLPITPFLLDPLTAAHLDDPAFRDEIIALMNAADSGIDGIAVERRRINALGIGKDPISGKGVPAFAEREVPYLRFRHKTEIGSAEFSCEAESRGYSPFPRPSPNPSTSRKSAGSSVCRHPRIPAAGLHAR